MKEVDVLENIRGGALSLPPIVLANFREGGRLDGMLQARWDGRKWQFALKVRARSTPKILGDVIASVTSVSLPRGTYPLIVVPYLNDEQLEELTARQLSAIDLSGNGVLVVPGELFILRTGKPNRYPEKSVLKSVYRGKVSLAARVFLLRPRYEAVGEIRDEIVSRGGKLALSTVSKVLARMEQDLIVSRDEGGIRLVQPEKLLDSLVREFEPPEVRRSVSGKTTLEPAELAARLDESRLVRELRVVPTGTSSTPAYAVMARPGPMTLYCSDINSLTRTETTNTIFEATERFANVVFEETRDDTVYFDVRRTDGAVWASPIQTYLELMSGDKRDRETAAQVADGILRSAA